LFFLWFYSVALLLRVSNAFYRLNTTKLEDVTGCAQYPGNKKSQAEMNAGISREAKLQVAAWSQQEGVSHEYEPVI
jgi:hypothetical protein